MFNVQTAIFIHRALKPWELPAAEAMGIVMGLTWEIWNICALYYCCQR